MTKTSDNHRNPGMDNNTTTTIEVTSLSALSVASPPKLSQIGFGHCGSVWGTFRLPLSICPDQNLVIKREDASPGRNIKNEVLVQSLVCTTTNFSRLSVPQCLGFISDHNSMWERILPLLPDGFQTASMAMISEKIPSISAQGRHLLVNKYAPPEFLNIRSDNGDWMKSQHCLARIYLGRQRRRSSQEQDQGCRRPRFFSLRNFPLHLDQAQELELPCEDYAKAMAETLATLHWKLRIDGADIEFVLGGKRRDGPEDNDDATLRQHVVWVLDYDCCATFQADEAGLESLARAFWLNDPYYPRPGSLDERVQKLWSIFTTEYVRVGTQMVKSFPRQSDNVDAADLVVLVRGAIEKIVQRQPAGA